ncbi:MAG: hypothetical protein GC165_01145 [Armatimonadetes bacterium]|nr:hypothetical protein [Armatimonadota bacterium]
MKPQYEAFTVRETETKTVWTRIGVAFDNRKKGLAVFLEAMPPAADGQYKILLLPPNPLRSDVTEIKE